MNYKRIHDEIIANRKNSPVEKVRGSGTSETHHIVPRSLGGSDDKENLIELLSREQFGTKCIFCYDPKDPTNMEKREEKKLPKESEIPVGWQLGRKMTEIRICKNPKCDNTFRRPKGGSKKAYCSSECRKHARPSKIQKNKEAFLSEFKKTGLMGHSLRAIGLPGAGGGWAKEARKVLEEEGLIHLFKHSIK